MLWFEAPWPCRNWHISDKRTSTILNHLGTNGILRPLHETAYTCSGQAFTTIWSVILYISIHLWARNVNALYDTIYISSSYASGEVDVDTLDGVVSAVEPTGIESNGIFLLGLFNSSMVTPSNFVIPTTGGSPFLTNSYWPIFVQISIWEGHEVHIYWPGILLPANRNASLATCSCTSPFNSNMILLTAILEAQWSKEPFPLPWRTYETIRPPFLRS